MVMVNMTIQKGRRDLANLVRQLLHSSAWYLPVTVRSCTQCCSQVLASFHLQRPCDHSIQSECSSTADFTCRKQQSFPYSQTIRQLTLADNTLSDDQIKQPWAKRCNVSQQWVSWATSYSLQRPSMGIPYDSRCIISFASQQRRISSTPCIYQHTQEADNGPAGPQQSASTQSSHRHADPAPNLKVALRRLYKRVHPDLFNDSPQAKAENERSFKLLQDYLHQARQGSRDAPAARVAYNFAFYVRAADLEQPPTHPTSDTNITDIPINGPPQFEKVQITLPPPMQAAPISPAHPDDKDHVKSAQAASKDRLAPSVRRALTRLFKSCGIEVAPGLGDPTAAAAEAAGLPETDELGVDASRLATFLPAAFETQRLAQVTTVAESNLQAANMEPGVRVANLRGAIRLQRKLLVSFKDPAGVPAGQQVKHILALAELLDQLPDLDLQGCHIQLGDSLGINKQGLLCLDIGPGSGGPEVWKQLLLGVDLDFVKERAQYMKAVRELEQRVAQTIGIHSVFPSVPSQAAEPSYRVFLERLAHAGATKGQIGSGNYKDVPVCVLTDYAFHIQQQQAAEEVRQGNGSSNSAQDNYSKVDRVLGVVCMPDSLSADQVYEQMTRQGSAALQCQASIRAHQQSTAALITRVRTALRLRHFAKDPQLADAHFQAACKRLLDISDAVSHITDGGSLRVGFTNRVLPDGTYVEIAYDFKP